jgi:hypothetical protein
MAQRGRKVLTGETTANKTGIPGVSFTRTKKIGYKVQFRNQYVCTCDTPEQARQRRQEAYEKWKASHAK